MVTLIIYICEVEGWIGIENPWRSCEKRLVPSYVKINWEEILLVEVKLDCCGKRRRWWS